MQLAAGRLRVFSSFSLKVRVRIEPNREELPAKARAHAERALPGTPEMTLRSPYWWRREPGRVIPAQPHPRLNSRTAIHLAEREAVVKQVNRVPAWRWHKSRMLTAELCRDYAIGKWW